MGTRQALGATAPSRAIMSKTRKPRRLLKKLSRPRGGNRRERGLRQEDRALVPGRSPRRAKEQHHPPMGETRDTAFGAARPEDEFGLYFRRHLPGRWKRRWARTPLLQQRGHGPASGRNLVGEISLAVAPGAPRGRPSVQYCRRGQPPPPPTCGSFWSFSRGTGFSGC
jgi:hypothetical protein